MVARILVRVELLLVGFPARLQAVANQTTESGHPSTRPGTDCGGGRIRLDRVQPLDRPLRTPGHRPPALDHRPLQLPLHLLHAPGGHALARPQRAAHLRGAGPDRAGVRGALRLRRRCASPAASPPSGRTCPGCSRMLAPLGVDIAMTTNGVRLPEMAHDLAAGRPAAHQRLARLAAARGLPRAHPPRRPRPGARRDRRRARRRARPGEGQLRGHPRRQRRRGRRPRRVRAGAGRRRALHRVHAPRRRRATGPATRSCRPTRSSSGSTRCSRSSTCRSPARTTRSTSSRPSGSATPTASATSA